MGESKYENEHNVRFKSHIDINTFNAFFFRVSFSLLLSCCHQIGMVAAAVAAL